MFTVLMLLLLWWAIGTAVNFLIAGHLTFTNVWLRRATIVALIGPLVVMAALHYLGAGIRALAFLLDFQWDEAAGEIGEVTSELGYLGKELVALWRQGEGVA